MSVKITSGVRKTKTRNVEFSSSSSSKSRTRILFVFIIVRRNQRQEYYSFSSLSIFLIFTYLYTLLSETVLNKWEWNRTYLLKAFFSFNVSRGFSLKKLKTSKIKPTSIFHHIHIVVDWLLLFLSLLSQYICRAALISYIILIIIRFNWLDDDARFSSSTTRNCYNRRRFFFLFFSSFASFCFSGIIPKIVSYLTQYAFFLSFWVSRLLGNKIWKLKLRLVSEESLEKRIHEIFNFSDCYGWIIHEISCKSSGFLSFGLSFFFFCSFVGMEESGFEQSESL